MPTVTDPKTGETHEISMEEFMEKIRGGGKISVRQEVHHADGTVTSSMIYGNDERDGIDRSINIFGTIADVIKPVIMRAAKIKETDNDAEIVFFMDNRGADYEITVDDTEDPLMHIVTCTKEEVRVARYIRDEQKSVGRPIAENTYKFTDGKLSATLDEVQEGNKLLLVAVGVYELRRIFEERGILQELKKLDNHSSGVVVTVKDEEVLTRIVRGRNRPDLPCLLFGGLFGQGIEDATMMRPYMDEMLGDTLRAGMSVDDMISAAEDGDIDYMESLVTLYLNGDDDTKPDPEKSVYWLQKMANAGSSVGMFNLGLHYAKGHGVKRDFLKAVEWMKKAAEAGDEDAPEAAARYQKIADSMEKAEAGDAQAMADLAGGLMEMGGSLEQAGPGEDYKEAFKWAKRAADLGNGDGIWTLALAYEHGRGVEQNIDKAVELYKHGAELGHAKSQNSYGAYLIRGDHGEKSPKKGFALCLAAAEKGEPLAMQNVGRCYQFATGVTGNMKTAIEWYEKSLQYLDDPEIAQKVSLFKVMSASDPGFGEDYGDPGYDDDEPMPDQEFSLTFTKKGDRKERSNRLKVGDKVTLKYETGPDKVIAYTSLGDIGEVSAASWIKTMLDKKVPHKAELSEVISYDMLSNKRQNPTVKVQLHFDKTCGEMRSKMSWDYIPGSIFDSGSSGYFGDANDVIRQNLESAGKPADDEAISNLSYDEALDAYMDTSDDENLRKQNTEKEKAERKRKEEEEERKRKEAEKKAAEEHLKAIEKEYNQAVDAWNKECDRIFSKRNSELKARVKQEEEKYKKEAQDAFTAAIDAADEKIAQQKAIQQAAQDKLSTLGLFKFSEKAEQNAIIAKAKVEIQKAETERSNALPAHNMKLAAMDENLQQIRDDLEDEINDLYPLPEKPAKPAELVEKEKKEKEKREAERAKLEAERAEREAERAKRRRTAYEDENTKLINKVAYYLAKSPNDNIGAAEFRSACIACNVDPDSFTDSDFRQLQRKLNEIT